MEEIRGMSCENRSHTLGSKFGTEPVDSSVFTRCKCWDYWAAVWATAVLGFLAFYRVFSVQIVD